MDADHTNTRSVLSRAFHPAGSIRAEWPFRPPEAERYTRHGFAFGVGMSRRLLLVGALLALQVALALLGVLNKSAIEVVPPLTLEATRRLAAGALLLAFIAIRGDGLRPGRRDLIDAVVPGVIGLASVGPASWWA